MQRHYQKGVEAVNTNYPPLPFIFRFLYAIIIGINNTKTMPEAIKLKITDTAAGKGKIFHFAGEMDEYNLEEVTDAVKPFLDESRVKSLIFDFSELTFINSKGIGFLVSVHTHLSKDGRSLVLAHAQNQVVDVLRLVGLTSIIPYYPTLSEATATLK